MASPNAVAASFADFTAAARIKCRTFTRIPDRKPNLDGGSDAAFLEIFTFSSEVKNKFAIPESKRQKKLNNKVKKKYINFFYNFLLYIAKK